MHAHRIVDAGSWSPTPRSWVTLIYERGRILGKTGKYETSKQREDEWGGGKGEKEKRLNKKRRKKTKKDREVQKNW